MAIYHLSAKAIERAKGRSAIAAVAYRSGSKIKDERTGDEHDYTRKRGIMHAEIMLPGGGTADRAAIWNAVERHHKRGDAVVAREVEVALPSELTATQRLELARAYARELAERYGVLVDVALHESRTVTSRDLARNPDQHWEIDPETGRRHNGNWHAHIVLSACKVGPDGELGKKVAEMDPIHCRRAKIENMVDRERARWAELTNAALEHSGQVARVDHRSHAERGLDVEPGQHLGPAAMGYERRTGLPSWLRQQQEAEAAQARLDAAALAAQEAAPVDAEIIDLSTRLQSALDELRGRQGRVLRLLDQWQTYLKDRPEVVQVRDAMARIAAREPGALERGEDLTVTIRANEVAAQERREAERQAAEHKARLQAEAAAKREAEAAMLAGLHAPSPSSPLGGFGQGQQSGQTRALEPRGGDQPQRQQDAFRELLERQKREAEAPQPTPEPEHEHDQEQTWDWGMDGP